MAESIAGQVAALRRMTVKKLQAKWREVFGENPKTRTKDRLWRGLADEIQAITDFERSRQSCAYHGVVVHDHDSNRSWFAHRHSPSPFNRRKTSGCSAVLRLPARPSSPGCPGRSG